MKNNKQTTHTHIHKKKKKTPMGGHAYVKLHPSFRAGSSGARPRHVRPRGTTLQDAHSPRKAGSRFGASESLLLRAGLLLDLCWTCAGLVLDLCWTCAYHERMLPILHSLSRCNLPAACTSRFSISWVEMRAVGNGIHFCDMKRASQRLLCQYQRGFPCITEVGRNPLMPQPCCWKIGGFLWHLGCVSLVVKGPQVLWAFLHVFLGA